MTPEIEQEPAMFDLLEDNSFVLPDRDGQVTAWAYQRVDPSMKRLIFEIAATKGESAGEFHLSLGRQVVKDYFQICSYFDAVKTAAPSQIRHRRMARGHSNEGAWILEERLEARRRSIPTRRAGCSR
jgi:uncharacterized protein (UPF0262 family)